LSLTHTFHNAHLLCATLPCSLAVLIPLHQDQTPSLPLLQHATSDEVFTDPHINPLDSTGFLWILRDSSGLQWTSIPIYLYGTPYNFLELDWTGVLSESTGIPVLLESCGLKPTGLQGNPQDCTGLEGNSLDYLIIAKYIYIYM